MSEPREEDWTFRTLKLYVDTCLDGLKELVTQRFTALALALDVALKAMESKLSLLNEIRGALSDANAKFALKEDVDRRFDEVRSRFEKIDRELAEGRGSKTGLTSGWGYLVGGIGALVGVVGVIVTVINVAGRGG
jgi:Flp pilus assembly protein TadB